ncbi:MAG: response regulator [Oligoflexales bacterium]|nr:response regulator [Oligoflexales bacterium]
MRGKVLVVDDAKIVLIQMQRIIESLDCQAINAIDAQEGIDAARKDPDIKLIIADINMPGMNGLEMCSEIRKMPSHKSTRIIICTTEASSQMKEKAKQIGVNGWLVKPINEATIAKLIEATFGKV